ncbi:probable RNA methyltransferase At5g51130 [Cryptomeria japonica]|uniref:probable RNA methyltransferase At5g51130 n=1 Tax=Cryptomeria japonica TaxID=3369 RepID=UPI0027DA658D|nr:probable RNA methyltransferase At5g51130 [Cryptomeria japonica]XP_057856755.2 probable RNA methyltransferase At5g51130 [Cryptomeria japonica]
MENRPNKNKRKDEGKNSSSQLTEYKKKRFFYVYGNYHSYYNYRIDQALDEDPRMKVLRKEWFEGKNCLDIGCNEGFITISIAQKFACKSIVGIDIDDRLIGKARSHLKTIAGVKEAIERNKQSAEEKCKVNADEGEDINLREQSYEGDDRINELESLDRREQSYEDDHRENRFQVIGSMKQFSKVEESTNNSEIICKKSVRDRISVLSRDCVSDNVEGRVGDQCLLERVCFRTENFIQESYSEFDAMYDTVLCLSVTKWVHLNWGDTGLIDLFAKIWQVLRPGGILILEPQPWKSYGKMHLVSEAAAENFHNIIYRPHTFRDILLDKIGFRSMERISAHVPDSTAGFNRPIYMLEK